MSASNTLWCVRLAGPDDVIAQPDYGNAVKYARVANDWIARHGAEEEMGRAYVEPWPWSTYSHRACLRARA